jgi:predicted dehydrogenase
VRCSTSGPDAIWISRCRRNAPPISGRRSAGRRGRIEIQIPVNAPPDAKTRLFLDDGSALDGSAIRTETLPESDQYQLQGEAFSRAIRGEIELPYGVEDAVRNMRVIDALFRSEKSARWEEV